jgi:hypothetical protein
LVIGLIFIQPQVIDLKWKGFAILAPAELIFFLRVIYGYGFFIRLLNIKQVVGVIVLYIIVVGDQLIFILD